VYRALAVTLLDERCLARDAESCHDLAVLYEKGTGVEQNADTAAALLQRARQLCTGKTSSFCDRLGASLK
jgi:TPR repeat protein